MDSQANKPVLITGGQGFLGRAAGKFLRRKGYRVISIDVAAERDEAADLAVQCDIADAESLRRVFQQERIAGIIHLAAILPTAAQRDPARATAVNILGSLNLLEMAREFSSKRFVFGSSVSIYGSWPESETVSEDSRAVPEDVYGAAKLYVERLGAAYRALSGLEFVSLRIPRVVGPGAESKTSAWRSEIFELLGATTATEITLPYPESERLLLAHVDDVAAMLVELLSASSLQFDVYNAACESMTVSELKRAIEAANPRLTVRAGEQTAAGNPRRLDASRFQREFGWRMVPLAEHLIKARDNNR